MNFEAVWSLLYMYIVEKSKTIAVDYEKQLFEERVTKNSNEIQRVIKVIDDIAFQTNLLALNAAVKVARAGVHGKDVAVVAEKVRNLATRNVKTAAETMELISKSGQEISNGSAVASGARRCRTSLSTSSNRRPIWWPESPLSVTKGVAQITVRFQQIDGRLFFTAQ